MIIESFERNSDDMVVAVGTEKIVLPWDYIEKHKPQVGDVVFIVDSEPEPVEEQLSFDEPAVQAAPQQEQFVPEGSNESVVETVENLKTIEPFTM